ncbi:MAG: thiolase domain-containing protein [Thermoplasmataceae archaeon]
MPLSNNVYIIGSGESKYGELWDRSLREISVEAGLKAIESSGIRTKDLGAIYMGNSLAGMISGQENIGALMSDYAGIADEDVPTLRVEASTASGAAAVLQAYLSIRSGEYDLVMVGGVEKMTELYGTKMIDISSSILDREWEAFFGGTPAAMAALSARKYMKDFNIGKDVMAAMAVNDHRNASLNPVSHFTNIITMEQAMNSTPVAEPLTLMDCAPQSDGASSIILASEKYMKQEGKEGVKIAGNGISQEYFALHSRDSLYSIKSTVNASRKALQKANINLKEISFAEIHDSFSIYGIMALEDIGFAERGKAKDIVFSEIGLNGSIPINPSGGLKAKGFPYGASGVGQFVEAHTQIMGKGGKRQVKDAKYGLLHSVAGTGSTSIVHVVGGD